MEQIFVGILLGIGIAYAADKCWKLIRPTVIADENFLKVKKDQIIQELKDEKVLITTEIHTTLDKFIKKLK